MGGFPQAPRIYSPGQTIRGSVDQRLIPAGFEAVSAGTEAQFKRALPRGDLEAPTFEVLNEEQFSALQKQDQELRKTFRPSPDQLEFQSELGQFQREDIPIFQLQEIEQRSVSPLSRDESVSVNNNSFGTRATEATPAPQVIEQTQVTPTDTPQFGQLSQLMQQQRALDRRNASRRRLLTRQDPILGSGDTLG